MAGGCRNRSKAVEPSKLRLLALIFDRVTWPFIKIDMRYEAYRHGGKYK